MALFTYQALRDEIEADPDGLGLKNSAASGDWKADHEVADRLNAPSTTARETVWGSVFAVLDETFEWAAIKEGALRAERQIADDAGIDAFQPSDAQRACVVAVDLRLSGAHDRRVDVLHPTMAAQLDVLVAAGVIANATRSRIQALGRALSRAEELWRRRVSASDVGSAYLLLGS